MYAQETIPFGVQYAGLDYHQQNPSTTQSSNSPTPPLNIVRIRIPPPHAKHPPARLHIPKPKPRVESLVRGMVSHQGNIRVGGIRVRVT